MNPKLLLRLFLGLKSALLLPMVSFAAIEPSSHISIRQSAVQIEVVDLNQEAKPTLVADRNSDSRRNNDSRRSNNNDQKRDNDQKKDYDNRRGSYSRQPVRVITSPVQNRQPIRVIHFNKY